jgi:uncharacterized protein
MESTRRILALAEPRASVEALEHVLEAHAPDVDAVAVVGDLTAAWSKPDTYRAIFKTLGESDLRAFWVPGSTDAPLREYLAQAHSMEIAFPLLRGIHGTYAYAPGMGNVVFAGMGGEVLDPPETPRSEEFVLRYPGWEVDYRLKFMNEIDQPLRVFLFSTPPAHKGLGLPGSDVLAELVNTYVPKFAIVGGEEPTQFMLGTSVVVAPGRLDQGNYAILDLRQGSAELGRAEVPGAVAEPVGEER